MSQHDTEQEQTIPAQKTAEHGPAAKTPAERARTDAVGPTTRVTEDLPGVTGSAEIHGNTTGESFRDGATPPDKLKWYVGQGGVTGTQSGTPFATNDPRVARAPDDPPPVGWDPASTRDADEEVAGGEARKARTGRSRARVPATDKKRGAGGRS